MVDSTGCSRGAVRGAHSVVGESDFLTIVAVLLVSPDDHQIFDQAFADFAACQPTLIFALETKVQTRECLRGAAWLVQARVAGRGLLTPC